MNAIDRGIQAQQCEVCRSVPAWITDVMVGNIHLRQHRLCNRDSKAWSDFISLHRGLPLNGRRTSLRAWDETFRVFEGE